MQLCINTSSGKSCTSPRPLRMSAPPYMQIPRDNPMIRTIHAPTIIRGSMNSILRRLGYIAEADSTCLTLLRKSNRFEPAKSEVGDERCSDSDRHEYDSEPRSDDRDLRK